MRTDISKGDESVAPASSTGLGASLIVVAVVAAVLPVAARPLQPGVEGHARASLVMSASTLVLDEQRSGDHTEFLRTFVTVLNNNPKTYSIADGRVTFDMVALDSIAEASGLYTAEDLEAARDLARRLSGFRPRSIAGASGEVGAAAAWYEDFLVTTQDTNYNPVTYYPDWVRWPAELSYTQSFGVGTSLSGRLPTPSSLLYNWTGTVYGYWERSFTFTVVAQGPCWEARGKRWNPYTVHTAWYDEYMYTDEDVKGQVVAYYLGRYSASVTHRYEPIYDTDQRYYCS